MSIDWTQFTPVTALAGGALIGAATAILLLLNGRIAGISGIAGGLFSKRSDVAWRLAFLAGLVAAPILAFPLVGTPDIRIDADMTTLAVAGLIVGLGTRYGAGCTSGHGVCGLSRFSVRSIAATAIFMLAGFLTVYVVRH
ncbi:MAG: YeeE/YedE family protein, partial [Arenimonas sp.]|uniref:YeeE/YedE family protein n=1 Tax=Arenimonas sp. TaxID=1872635 RepID=UPI003C0F262E